MSATPPAFGLPVARPPLPQCDSCAKGDHDDCIDNAINAGAVDALDFCPPICGCDQGESAPVISWASAEWLHNCSGCPCECHDDPKTEALVRQCWQCWFDSAHGPGPKLDALFARPADTYDPTTHGGPGDDSYDPPIDNPPTNNEGTP